MHIQVTGSNKKGVANVYDLIQEVEKFNPYHGPDGRFTSAGNATSFTIRTRAGYQQGMADRSIQRAKDKYKESQSKKTPKPTGDYEADRKKEWQGADFAMSFRKDKSGTLIDLRQKDAADKYEHLRRDAVFGNTGDVYMMSAEKAREVGQAASKRLAGKTDHASINRAMYDEVTSRNDLKKYSTDYYKEQQKAARQSGYQVVINTDVVEGAPYSVNGGQVKRLPDDLSNTKVISGDTYQYRSQIKAAGFTWNPNQKAWVKKSIDYITEIR